MPKNGRKSDSGNGTMGLPVDISVTEPKVTDMVQESREQYFASLNPQMDVPSTGLTGVEVADTAAIYMKDTRLTLVETSFATESSLGVRRGTSASWTAWLARIANMIQQKHRPDFSTYADFARPLYDAGIIEEKLLGLSIWNMCMADMYYGQKMFGQILRNPHRYAQIVLDDENFEGQGFLMTPLTWNRAVQWMRERTAELKSKYGALMGIFKGFVDAYIYNHRAIQVTRSYFTLDRRHKRPKYVYNGFPNCCIREDGSYSKDTNGLIDMEALYDWLMADLADFEVVREIVEKNGTLDWLMDSIDPVTLGTGMKPRFLERDIDETLFQQYASRIIVTNSVGAVPAELGFLQNELLHKWFGDKPTWFASIFLFINVRLSTLNYNIFEEQICDLDVQLFDMDDETGNQACNVYMFTYKQVDQGRGNVEEAFLWAPVAQYEHFMPYMYAVSNRLALTTLYTAYVANPLTIEAYHETFLRFGYEYDPEMPLKYAAVPVPMYFNANGVRGFYAYLEHYVNGTLGSFPKNVYRRSYGSGEGNSRRQLDRGQRNEKSNRKGDKLSNVGDNVSEGTSDKPDRGTDSNSGNDTTRNARGGNSNRKGTGFIDAGDWAKLSPAEKKAAIDSRK